MIKLQSMSKANYTEITINAEVAAFGTLEGKYKDIKIDLNQGDEEVTIAPVLVDENNDEAIYITLNKEQCYTLAAILKTFGDLI